MKKIILTSALAILMASQLFASVYVGYTNETVKASNKFRFGTKTDQRIAVRFSADKLTMLKGKQVTGIRMAFASKNSTDNKATLFLANSLDGDAITTQEVTITSENEMLEFALDTPYTISGDESELYVGCMLTIAANYGPFSSDFTTDNENIAFAYGADGWQDLYGKGYGAPNIELVVEDADFTDLMVKSKTEDGFLKENQQYTGSFEVYNFGTKEVSSFDATVSMGGEEKTVHFDETILPKQTYTLTADLTPTIVGTSTLKVEISNVNGVGDDDSEDNSISSDIYIYKADCQKNVLVEGFTGQTCSNCSSGHASMATAISETGVPTVMLYHHSGYVSDYFTMTEDWTVADNFNVQYAPAAMANRTLIGSNLSPVFDPWSRSNCTKALNQTNAVKPYVEISLEPEFNTETREVTLHAKVKTLEAMPGDDIRYSVWLTQDNIVSPQSGAADDYVHMAVSRGCLTDANGDEASFVPGETLEIEKTFVLPDTIASTSYKKTDGKNRIEVVPKDMKLVFFVHQYSTSASQSRVFNCEEVAITDEDIDGITNVNDDDNADDDIVRKCIKNGRLVIMKNNQTFRIDGIKVK